MKLKLTLVVWIWDVCRTALGIRTKDGVVLAVEKLVHSKLLVPGSNRRIQTIDPHVGLVSSSFLHLSFLPSFVGSLLGSYTSL